MSKSLIQVSNPSTQTVSPNSIIQLGSVQRRFGCNLRLSGNAIECEGEGYYSLDAAVTVTPIAAGDVIVSIYENGSMIPGAIGSATAATAGDTVTIPLLSTIRKCCCNDGASNITIVLNSDEALVSNVSLRITKE